jgi:hypothetical protein
VALLNYRMTTLPIIDALVVAFPKNQWERAEDGLLTARKLLAISDENKVNEVWQGIEA